MAEQEQSGRWEGGRWVDANSPTTDETVRPQTLQERLLRSVPFRRVIAKLIDWLFIGGVAFAAGMITRSIVRWDYEIQPAALVMFALATTLPFLMFGPVEYLTGRTPGKLLTRLTSHAPENPALLRPIRYLLRALLYSGVTALAPLFLAIDFLNSGFDATGQVILGYFLFLVVLTYQIFDLATLLYPPMHRSATERLSGISSVDSRAHIQAGLVDGESSP